MTKNEIIAAILKTPAKYHYMTYDEMEMCTKKGLMQYYEDIKEKQHLDELAELTGVSKQIKMKFSSVICAFVEKMAQIGDVMISYERIGNKYVIIIKDEEL